MITNEDQNFKAVGIPLGIVYRNPLNLVQAYLRTRKTSNPYCKMGRAGEKDSQAPHALEPQSSLGSISRVNLAIAFARTDEATTEVEMVDRTAAIDADRVAFRPLVSQLLSAELEGIPHGGQLKQVDAEYLI